MAEKTTIKTYRLKNKTITGIEKIAGKQKRKPGTLVSIILDEYIRKNKNKIKTRKHETNHRQTSNS